MGKLNKDSTLKGHIVSSFYLILFYSIITTVITLIITALILINIGKTNPANYYEKQIPKLVSLIQEQTNILEKDKKETIDNIIPLEGMDYQVIDIDGNILYGTMNELYVASHKELLTELNNTIYDNEKIIKYYPLFDDNNKLHGGIGFRYEISLVSSNPSSTISLSLIGIFLVLSPFIYLLLFSYFIGKRLSNTIEKPFNEIIKGAYRIQNHELDFTLSHVKSVKELNELTFAFEEMKDALQESLQRQWALEQDRKDMIAMIAHDLKNPLTIIQGHIDGLLEMKNKNPERLNRYLKTIKKSSERMVKLLHELNDITQIQQFKFQLDFKPVDLMKWINEKKEEYNTLCSSNNIGFNVVLDEIDLQTEFVWIDSNRINQILDNIIMNSLKFTPKKGVIIWKIKNIGDDIIFEISDNGPGFSSANTTKVFQKYFRETPAVSSSTSNHGLGLFIAQTIAKEHGGEILAKNKEGGGASVTIIIKDMNNRK